MYENSSSSTQNTHRTSAWPRKSGSVLHVNLQKGHHYTYVTMARRVRGLWKINIRPRQDLHSFRICGFQFVLPLIFSFQSLFKEKAKSFSSSYIIISSLVPQSFSEKKATILTLQYKERQELSQLCNQRFKNIHQMNPICPRR